MEVKSDNLTSDIKEYRKKYYEDNKNTYYKQEHICLICGGKYKINNKSHHNNSKKHQNAIIKNELQTLKLKFNEMAKIMG